MDAEFNGVILGEYADPEGGLAYLSDRDRRRHAYLIGKTGTGKSSLIETIMQSDLARNRGFGLLDPHGDLAERIADSIPSSRFDDVIYVDPADPDYHIAINVDRRGIVDRLGLGSARNS